MLLTTWDGTLSTGETNDIAKKLAQWHLSQVSEETNRNFVLRLLGDSSYYDLCHYNNVIPYASANEHYHVESAIALFKKRADLDIGIDCEAAAWKTFVATERLCEETNRMFKLCNSGQFFMNSGLNSKLFRAQKKIASCLGLLPTFAELNLGFGNGATTKTIKRKASARCKLSEAFTCSEDLAPKFSQLMATVPGWWVDLEIGPSPDQPPCLIGEGRLEFVPKSAKTHRAIMVEPILNGFLQKGYGKAIKERLRIKGIDITDQTRNQELARIGSITGDLATLDLSSASDCIATELVWHLLPYDWAEALSYARTSKASYKGQSIKLQKFSSNGNGFTFPLETLIFWALACACVDELDEQQVSVYGDDIIVPTYAYDDLTALLLAVGFLPNKAKSFAAGPFRESCGKDYFSGILVRPVFLKTAISAEVAFTLHNYYVRNNLTEPASIILEHLDPTLRLVGPDGYGDGHLLPHGEMAIHLSPHKRELGWSGYTFETWVWCPRKSIKVFPGDRVLPLYCTYVRSNNDEFSGTDYKGDAIEYEEAEKSGSHGTRVNVHRSYLRRWAIQAAAREITTESVFFVKTDKKDKEGKPIFAMGNTIPGNDGYRRIRVYTLSS